jgi:hypothetical protein
MGAKKTKLNKAILRELETRTHRKKEKKMLFRNNYFSLYFASGSPEEIKTMCVSFIR